MNGEPETRSTTAPLFAGIAIAFFAPGILFGKIPAFRDSLVLMVPLRWFAREARQSGILPLWTDGVFFGAPFLANYQSAALYPPSGIIYWLPFEIGFSLFLAFHLWIAGWGMAHYLERHHGLGTGAAAFGGLVFALGGFLISLVSLANQLVVAAWLPWVLAASEELVRTASGRSFLRLTLVIALQALGGAPEALLLTIALAGAVTAREIWQGRGRWEHSLGILGAICFAAALAAIQLVPTAEYVSQTDRAGGLPYDIVTSESLPPRSLLQLIVPHAFEDGAPAFVPEGSVPLLWSIYVGIVPLALALTAIMLRPLGLWPLVFCGATLLSFGAHTPIFSALYATAPGVIGAFRFPMKFFLPCHFALALLSARALDDAARGGPAERLATISVGALFGVGAAVAVSASLAPTLLLEAFGYLLPPSLGAEAHAVLAARLGFRALRGAALSLAALAMLRLFGSGRIAGGSLLTGLGLLTAVDLFSIHQPTLVFTDWSSLFQSGARLATAADPGERMFHYCTTTGRCVPHGAPGLGPWGGALRPGENAESQARALWAALAPDAPIVYGLGAVAGSDGFSTRMQKDFFRALALLPRERAVHLLASLGVSRLIGREPLGTLAGLTPVGEAVDDGFWQYTVSPKAPRTYLAERVLAAADTASALELLSDPSFRPGLDAVMVGPGAPAPEGVRGEISIVSFQPAEIRADVVLPAEGLWVVSGSWFPGWEARIDGTLAEVIPVNGIHRGVRVAAGKHHVEMRYRPRSLMGGAAVSQVAIITLLLGSLVTLARQRLAR